MIPFFNSLSGKSFATRPWLSLSHKMGRFILALTVSIAFLSFTSQAQTYKAISLDGGGWLSGFAQADNGRLYAYGDVFGAWRSDDVGKTWTYLNWGIPDGDIAGLGMAVQKDNADVVYYSTGGALYKSTNGGTDWTKLLGDVGEYTPRFRGSSPILIRANNPNEIWFAGPRKNLTGWLWKSSNGGKDWVKAGGSNFDTNRARTLHNISAFPNEIWVGSDNGLYVSTDGGSNFTRVSTHGEVGMIQRFVTGPDAGAGLITRTGISGVDAGGITRITATDYSNTSTYTATPSATESIYFGYPTGLQIFSDNTAVAWNTGGDRQGYSTDGGRTFKVRPTTLNTTNVPIWTTAEIMDAKDHPDYGTDQVIQVGNDPNHWMITGGGAAMESFDKGLSWSYFPNGSGIAAVKAYTVDVSRHDENRLYIPASDIGAVVVTDGGASGTAQYSTTKTNVYLHGAFQVMEGADVNNLIFAGVHQGENRNLILKTTNGGASWAEVVSNLPASKDGINKAVSSFNDVNDFIAVLSEVESPAKRVYRTTNGGTTFVPVSDLPDNMPTGGRYGPQNVFIDRDATQANVRYFVARGTAFYKSTNGGSNWTPTTHPYDGNAWVWGLHADPVRSGNLWAAGDWAGVRYSFDGGTSWATTVPYFNARLVSSYDGKIALWGYRDGESIQRLWYSPDNGANWYPQSTAAKNFHGVQGITVDSKGKIWVSWNSVTIVTPVIGEPVADTQAPTVPSGLTSSSVTSTSFTLSWTASTDNVGVSSYEVFRNGTSLGTTASTSFNVSGLTAGTAYSMTVRAKDAAGNYSAQSSALSVTTTAASDTQAPTVPSGLTSSSVTSTSFTLSWTASTDNVGVALYEVFKDGTSLGTTTSTSYTVTGLTAGTAYSMTVRAKDAAGNYSAQSSALSVTTTAAVTLRDADNPASTVAGLDYQYYEGNWSVLPNFDGLTAVKQGNVTNFDLTPRNRNDNFGFKFTGYVNVPSDGTYTFYASSDDGSKLYIGTTQVVNNDGLHGSQERSGTIGLKAGKHAITVIFFESSGGESLSVSYSGPSVSKQTIPASALFRSGTTSSITGNFGFENDFTNWYTYGTTSINTTAANVRSGAKSGYFSGGSNSTAGANYTVTGLTAGATYVVKAWVKAVSGSNIWITAAPSGGSQVGQQMTSTSWTQSGNIVFTLGANATSATLSAWVGNNSSAYFDDFTIEACSNCRTASAEVVSSQFSESLILQVYPNPANREVSISLAGFEAESSVQVKMSDMSGKLFVREQVQPRVAGKQVTFPVNHLPQGLFFVTVQGSKARKTAKLIITK
jgi:chitodextrinase